MTGALFPDAEPVTPDPFGVPAPGNPLDIDPELVTDLLVRFIREELRSAGIERAVVGLSGGVDSAVSAALAVRALGAEAVLAVMLPYRTSSPDSEGDARRVAEALAMPTRKIDISTMVDSYFDQESVPDGMRRGNVMGCQFHPEKSQRAGERVLRAFLSS